MAKTKNNSSNKKKKKSKVGPNSISMKQKQSHDKLNPFETISSRRKFDILGKKRKGEDTRISQSRSLSIHKRNKTLLKEYQQSKKSSVFSDKRIGENDEDLAQFHKAILRSQRQRQKGLNKTSKYNLSDGEEDELEIYGGERDDFNEEMEGGSDDGDVDDDNRSTMFKRLKSLHERQSTDADLAGEEEKTPKSKKEVMNEVILKSKFFKAQKANEKEENEKLVEQLDNDFESLVQAQAFSSLTQPSKMNALKALVNPTFSKELKKKEVASVSKFPKQDEPDSYDKLLNEVMLEIRARPSDRKKTPEEIAEEEKERLERLEQERQNRMLATDEASDDDHHDPEGVGISSVDMSTHISGDDLGDSFVIDDKPSNKKGWVDAILERGNNSEDEDGTHSDDSGDSEDNEVGSEEDEENVGEAGILKDWEQSDDDVGVDSENKSDEESEGEASGKVHAGVSSKRLELRCTGTDSDKAIAGVKQSRSHDQDLPFKIDAPTRIEELHKLFEGRCNEDIIEAVRRIRGNNAIALAAENRKKIQVFYGLLLQHFATLANEKPLNFQLLNLLVKPLMEMSAEIPYFSAICARERILRMRTKFCEDTKDPDKSCWPSPKTLLLLRLWSMTFPCSDFRHAVATPTILFMCEYLMRCPILSVRDAAIGSFLCSQVLSVIKESQKFCPEALVFLKTLLLTAVDRDQRYYQFSQSFHHLLELKAPLPLLRLQERVDETEPLNFLKIMNLPEDSSFFNTHGFRASVIVSTVETLRGFVNVYGNLKAFPEIFSPISALLLEVGDQQNMAGSLQEKLRGVAELIIRKAEEHQKLRGPLQMRKQKPVPIKLLTPKFEENYIKGRDYDPNRERAESKKLKKIVAKEKRGAARELRKDNYFLLEKKEKEKQRAEEERAEKYGKARAFLQEQEHACKSGQLGKGRKRGR